MDWADFRLAEYCVVFALAGAASGLASGLFGIGGGIMRIPIFVMVFPAFGIHAGVEMHVAAATSLALAVPSGVMALRKHVRLGNFEAKFFQTWSVGVVFGVLAGIAVAPHVSSWALKVAFVVFLVLMAGYFGCVPDRVVVAKEPPGAAGRIAMSGGIGAYCVMIGIAGGSLATPLLKMCSMPLMRALAVGSGTSMLVSGLGTVGGIWNGLAVPGRPAWSLGFVDGLVLLCMLPGVLVATPLGVTLASRMNSSHLKRCYAVFLVIIVAVMILHMVRE